jgi:hypothetical protein
MSSERIKAAFITGKANFETLKAIRETGFTDIILNYKDIDYDVFFHAHSNYLKVAIEVGCFIGEDVWEKYPTSRPLVRGKPIAKLGPLGEKWYAGVIPLVEVIEDRLNLIGHLLERYQDTEALFLDFCRFPGRWEDGENQAIVADNTENDPSSRQVIITNFVKRVLAICDKSNTQLGIFLTPYDNDMYGQNIKYLRNLCHFLSPMLYHKICQRPIEWVGKKIREFSILSGKPILPIIQSIPEPEIVSPAEFEGTLKQTLHEGSLGFAVLNWEALNTEMRSKMKIDT